MAYDGPFPLPIGIGGTGVSSTPTNGQTLIGNGSGYALAAITAGKNVSVANGSGTITLDTSNTASVTSVDLKTAASTKIFTTPSGITAFIPTGVGVLITASNTFATPAS